MLDHSRLFPLPAYSETAIQLEQIADYLSYYQLDFKAQDLCDTQSFGALNLGGFQICVQGFFVKNPKASIVFLHGYMDHLGSHNAMLQRCLLSGFNVIGFDLPGHGLSSGERGHIQSFDQYRDVLSDLTTIIKNNVVGERLYLMGHSTGCSAIIHYLQTANFPCYEKAVLLAPLVEPTAWWWIKFQLSITGLLKREVKRKYIQNTTNDHFWFFMSQKDPLQVDVIAIDWLKALDRWLKENFSAASPKTTPILMFQGTKDATVNGTKNTRLLQEKFSNFTCIELEGAKHHLSGEASIFLSKIHKKTTEFIITE